MALKRIQKVSGAELWEGAERSPCPRVVARAVPLLAGVEAAAGASSAEVSRQPLPHAFSARTRPSVAGSRGSRVGVRRGRGALVGSPGLCLLEGPAAPSQCLRAPFAEQPQCSGRCGSGESRGADGEPSAARRDSIRRCPCVRLLRAVLGAGLRSVVSIVLGVTFERIPVVVFWADTCKWPGSSCELPVSFCLARLSRSLYRTDRVSRPAPEGSGGSCFGRGTQSGVFGCCCCAMFRAAAVLSWLRDGAIISCAGFPFAIGSHWYCRNRIV